MEAEFFDPQMAIMMDDHAGAGGFWDVMATEEFTYPGIKALAEISGLEVVGLPTDA